VSVVLSLVAHVPVSAQPAGPEVPQASIGDIASIDFAAMIGGPLLAAVRAQMQSSETTMDYLNSVGFDNEGKAKTVSFSYTSSGTDGSPQTNLLEVPLLSLVPIPFLRIDTVSVSFKASITSVAASESFSSTSQSRSKSSGYSVFGFSGSVSSSFSSQQERKDKSLESREYSMEIFVQAEQEEMSAGMRRVLNALSNAVETTVVDA